MTETRSLRGYLLLPRPKDAVKWWILPLTFGLGVLARGGVGTDEALRALVVWLCLELLIYQARYQCNDIRGFEADQAHPDAGGRGRLPGPLARGRAHKAASWAVAALRLLATAAIAAVFPGMDLAAALVVLTASVLAVALLYEALRERATGHDDRVPPPVTPDLAALWVAVGGGYAIRGLAGLALAVPLTSRPLLAGSALVTMWAFGVAFVTARWAVEALAFARLEGGHLVWSARAEQAREHLLALTRWLPADRLPTGVALPRWRALAGPTALTAPWNVAALVAATAAGVMGRALAGPAGVGETLLAGAAAAATALIVLRAPARGRTAACGLGALVLAGILGASGSPSPVLAALPWAGIMAAQRWFSGESLSTVGRSGRRLLARRDADMPWRALRSQRG